MKEENCKEENCKESRFKDQGTEFETETVQEQLADVEQSGKGRKGLFRNPQFVIFSTSQSASLLGDKLGYMALLAMVATLYPATSSQVLSSFSIVIALPTLILGPIALLLIDRIPRKQVLIISDVVRLILVFGAPIPIILFPNQWWTYWLIIGFLLLYFTFTFTFNAVRCSIIPDIVDKEHLHGANSFINLINRVTTFVGMLGGGFLVSLAFWDKLGIPGWTTGFFADGFTFAISVVALLALRPRPHLVLKHETVEEATRKIRGTFKDTIEVLRFIAKTPEVLAVSGSIILFGVLNAMVFVVLVPMIQTDFALQTWGVGVMGGIAAVGLVLGSILYGVLGKRISRVELIFISFGIMGASLIVSSIFPNPISMAVVAFIGGGLYTIIQIAQDTLLQAQVPNVIRGRIFSAREWLYMGSFMAGSLLLGASAWVAHKHILVTACGAFFVLCCVWGLTYMLLKKRSRDEGSGRG